MTNYWTAQQTVAYLASFNGGYWGTNTGYVNPFSTELYGHPVGHYWCTDAVVAAYLKAGLDLRPYLTTFAGPGSFSVCANLVAWYGTPQGRAYFREVAPAKAGPGAQIIYWNGALNKGRGRYYHTGMIAAPASAGYLHTEEGDTSSPLHPGSESTGGVMRRRDDRRISNYDNPPRPGAGHWGVRTFEPLWLASTPAPTPPAPTGPPVLSLGSRGAAVKHLQADFNRIFPAYGHLAVDGSYGYATRHAVMTFQTRTGLDADGVVGPLTWAKLATYGVKQQ